MSRRLPITSTSERPTATEASPTLRDVDDAGLIPLRTAFHDTVERDDLLRPYFAGLGDTSVLLRLSQ